MRLRVLVLLAMLVMLLPRPVAAHGVEDILITDVWARPAIAMTEHDHDAETTDAERDHDAETDDADHDHDAMTEAISTSAVFMHIENLGGHPLRLVSATSPVAESVEIHESVMGEGDVMQMRPTEYISIGVEETVVLEPGGYHIMLIGILEDLAFDMAFPVTLTFDMGNDVTLDVTTAALVSVEAPTPSEVLVGAGAVGPHADEPDHMQATFMLYNRSTTAERLVGISTPVAGDVEFYSVEGETATLVDGLDLPAESVLENTAFYVLLHEWDAEAAHHQAIVVTLEFESGRTLTLALPVIEAHDHDHEAEATAAPADGHSHSH